MGYEFSQDNCIFLCEFGTPCQFQVPSPPIGQPGAFNFTGIYYAPNSNQGLSLTPQRTLAISSARPSLWVNLADFATVGAPPQDSTIVIDPDGLTVGPLTRKVFDIQEDGGDGAFLILKKSA